MNTKNLVVLPANYAAHLAEPIQRTWKYKSHVKYRLSLRHSQSLVKYESNRPACSYTTLDVTLTWDLLRHRWQWIGGMLTISAKADAGKKAYPCWWFQQRITSNRYGGRRPGVGLEVKQGWVINGYHVSSVSTEAEARLKKARIIERANEKASAIEAEESQRRIQRETEQVTLHYKAAPGWVNRRSSIAAGNCSGGTDNFIAARVAPFFQQLGYICGDLRGISIRVKTLLQIEKSHRTKRVCDFAKIYEK